jgi:hypothetical protein
MTDAVYLQTPYERIPRIWVSIETPPRVLFVKGRSGIDPDCLVAFAESAPDDPLWIVDDGSTKYDKPDYYVCDKSKGFRARPVVMPVVVGEARKP